MDLLVVIFKFVKFLNFKYLNTKYYYFKKIINANKLNK